MADNIFGNILGGIGNAFNSAADWGAHQIVDNFTPAVKNFVNTAQQANNALPNSVQSQSPVASDIAAIPGMISGIAHQGAQYFNPENVGTPDNPIANFWQTAPAQQLGNLQQGIGNLAKLRVNFAQPAQQATQNLFGNNPVGQAAGVSAGILAGIPQSIINVPADIAQAGTDIGTDVRNGQFTGTRAVGDIAEAAMPIATIWTMGEGPSIIKSVVGDSWKTGVLKGLANSMPIGGAFGLGAGLEANKNAKTYQEQIQNSLPYIAQGMLTAGALTTVLGVGGKVFFGGKPGDAAAMSANGLVPPETMNDAYNILGVDQNASLADIRSAYANAVTQLHPNGGGTPEAMDVLNNAYEMTTRNTAPTLTFDEQNNPIPQWNDQFGGNSLSVKQVAAARRAAADNTAFQARIENLKAGRLPIKNPNQPAGVVTPDDFLTKGADLLSPEGNSQMVGKLRQSAENQANFHSTLDTVAQQFGGRALSSIKNPETLAEKIIEHRNAGESNYGIEDVGDSLRGALIVNDKSQIPEVVQALENQMGGKGWARYKTDDNFFSKPQDSGYEGYHVDIQMPDGQKAEIQIHTPNSWAYARISHNAYETYNNEVPPEVKTQLDSLKQQIDSNAPANNEAIAKADELRKADNVLSPMESDYTGNAPANPAAVVASKQAIPEPPATSPQLSNMLKARETLRAQLKPTETTPEIEGMVQLRDNLQQQLDAANNVIKINPSQNDVAALKSHALDLQDKITKIDTQVKDMQGKLGVTGEEKSARIQTELTKLDKQIQDEQTRLQVKGQVDQGKAKIAAEPTIEENPDQLPPEPVIGNEQSYAPPSGFRDNYQFVADNLLGKEQNDLGMGRQMVRIVKGGQRSGETLGDKIASQIQKDLPDLQSRENVQYALGGSIDPTTLNPAEKDVYDQLQGILKLSKDIRSSDPQFKELQNYAPFYALRPGDNATPDIKSLFNNLSDFSRENLHRQIRAFQPVNGGPSLIGMPEKLGLTGKGSTFEDAQGNQYLPRMATQKEVENAGLVEYEKDVAETMRKNLASTVKYKTNNDAINTIKSGKYGVDVSDRPFPGAQQINNVPGLKGLYFSKKMADSISQFAVQPKDDPLALRMFDAGQNAIRNTVFYNMFTHPINMYANSIVGASKLGPTGILDFNKNLIDAAKSVVGKDQNYVDAQQAGTGVGDFGRGLNQPGIFERTTDALFHNDKFNQIAGTADTLNPLRQFYRANKAFVAFSDDVFRQAMYNTALDHGYSPEEAANHVNHFLVDYGNTGTFEKNVVNRALIFYPWLKGNLGILGGAIRHPIQNIGPIVTMALMYGGLQEYQNWERQQTGNPDARVRMPGVFGTIRDLAEAPGQIMQGQIPGIAANHIQPLIRGTAQQVANRSYFPDLFNPNGAQIVKNNEKNPTMARLGAAATLLGPEQEASAGLTGKKTPGEILQNQFGHGPLNGFLGISTPHLKGFMAEPNQPNAKFAGLLPINAPTTKNTTGMEIIHGQQAALGKLSQDERNQYNMLSTLSAKGDSASLKQYRNILAGSENIWNAKSTIEKTNAQANGRQVDPLYNLSYDQAKNYLNYESMSSTDKGTFAENNPSVVDVARQRDAYYQSPDYKAYQQDLKSNLQGYKGTPIIHNPIYDAFPTGTNTFQTAFGSATVDGNQGIADYNYWKSLPSGQQKTSFAANHPWVYDGAIAEAPYSKALMQQKWDTRPAGQSVSDFISANTQTINGKTVPPNFTGVDSQGKIIQAYNPIGDPLYQASPQLRSAALAYTAFNEAGNKTAKQQILAQYPQLVDLWTARNAYFQANPIANPGDSTGIGVNFTSSGGGSGSSYSSSYNPNSYLQREFLYSALKAQVDKFPITSPKPVVTNGAIAKLALKPGAVNQGIYGKGNKIPLPPTQTANQKAPKITMPKVGKNAGRLQFRTGGASFPQDRVQAGRIQTRLQ